MIFDWNDKKATINLAKHSVSFDEAQTVFDDLYYVDFFDPDHSETEHRYIRMGFSNQQRLLIVYYTERNNVIRLISARKTTKKEKQFYEDG
jgi:uncharacterized DUF497 family protein